VGTWPKRVAALLAIASVAAVAWLFIGDEETGGPADSGGAEVETIEFESDAVGASQAVKVVIPSGAADEGRPLLVFLHGRGGDEETNLVTAMYEGLEELGERAPIVAFPDGGDSSYWHDRATGDWGSYVIDEVIPTAVEETGADSERVAIGGISMGGFGALDLARLNPGDFCAVGGHSPAIWATSSETAEGAFDDAEDFDRHDLVTAALDEPGGLDGPEIWLDTGESDPFLAGFGAFSDNLAASGVEVEEHVWPGGHDGDYWNAHWPDYLRFYGRALARC
jgi:S-formylglutathione hydrolase FrmB